MELGTVCLSFDDGRGDNLQVAHELAETWGLPATFNITTGYVDGNCPPEFRPSARPALTPEQVRTVGALPQMELALHGDYHLNTPEDIAAGREKLLRWLDWPADTALGFASPGSRFDVGKIPQTPLFSKQITYIRTGLQLGAHPVSRTLARRAARALYLSAPYRYAYAATMMDDVQGRVLYSVPVMRHTTFRQVRALAEDCIRQKKLLILMFHSIGTPEKRGDHWYWSEQRFHRLCAYLAKKRDLGNLAVRTTADVFCTRQP